MSAAIPPIKGVSREATRILLAMKENIDQLRGRLPKQAKMKTLDSNASLAQSIAKINELVELLQE